MTSLADACRDGGVRYSAIEDILLQIEGDEHNPYGGINDQDKYGESAMRWICSHGRSDLLKLLPEYKANVKCLNDLGQTPLHAACWNTHVECCKILLSSEAEINLKDRDGCTSLHKVRFCDYILIFKSFLTHTQAAWKGNKDIVTLLIQAGAMIDEEDANGATPLHYASVQGHEAIVSLLLSRGAKVQHCDKKAISAIQRATTSGRLEVVKILLNKNADLEATDPHGECR